MPDPNFLTLAEVFYLHSQLMKRFGGTHGIRDQGLVESAMASAKNAWLYGSVDLFEIAATYAFHLAESQPFLDGNKRVGAAAALSFLRKNGHPVLEDNGTLYNGMIAIAKKQMNKAGLAAVLRHFLPSKGVAIDP